MGAADDSRAPYNQDYTPREKYGMEAIANIEREMDSISDGFREFMETIYDLDTLQADIEKDTYSIILGILSRDGSVRGRYIDRRIDDEVERLTIENG